MTKINQDITMWQGDTKVITCTTYNATGGITNLTGGTIEYKLYETDYTVQVTKTTSSGIVITDAANGVFQVTLSPSDTLTLLGTYLHEAELTDANSAVSTLFIGDVTIKKSVV